MAKSTVLVGCKLPHGMVLEHPLNGSDTVTIKGLNKRHIIGSTYATTEVDKDFWDVWLGSNAKFPPIMSGAIFVAKNAADVNAIAKEYAGRKTGFEPMKQDAMGVKSADKE